MTNYEAVYPSKEEMLQKRNVINKQREEYAKLELNFKDIIQQIINKFHEYIENEIKLIEFEEIILSKVEKAPYNYYHFINFRELPINYKEFNKPQIGS